MMLFFYALAQLVEMSLGIWVIRELYPEKREHALYTRIIIVSIAIVWGILSVWNASLSFVSNIFTVFNSLFLSVLIFIYLRSSYYVVFIWETLYNISLALIKMLFLILEGVLNQKTVFEVNCGIRNFKEIIGCFLIYLLIFISMYQKKDMLQLLKAVSYKYRKSLGVICCIEWSMLTYSMYLGRSGFSTASFVLHFIFIVCTVLVTIFLLLNALYQRIKIDKHILDAFQSNLEKQNEVLQSLYNQNNKKIHDIKHIMLYISNCLENGRIEEAQEQVFRYTNELKGMEQKIWTSFPFLDFIINYKKQEMDEKKISFNLEVDLYHVPFEEAELGIVLGNLLDNAIEASCKCELYKRSIYLKIGNLNHMFLLTLKNSNTKIPKIKDGKLLTTKKDYYAHGLGVESVKRIVKKYNGNISFQYDNEHFEVDILI